MIYFLRNVFSVAFMTYDVLNIAIVCIWGVAHQGKSAFHWLENICLAKTEFSRFKIF